MASLIIGDISTFPVNLDPAIITGSLLVSGSSSDPKIDIKGPAAGVAIRATGSIDITGDLLVGGTTTTINSTTLTVDDKNIELGSTASPSDTSADGGGITLKGASDYTIAWTNSTDRWHFNQGIQVDGYPIIAKKDNDHTGGAMIAVEQDGTGDAIYKAILTGGPTYTFGIDNSDDNKFKLGYHATSATEGVHTNTLLTVISGGGVGIGEDTPLAKLHVKSGESSVSTFDTKADDLIIENNTNAGISIAGGATHVVGLYFPDASDPDLAYVKYDHGANAMAIRTNGSDALHIDSSQRLGVGVSDPDSKIEVLSTTTQQKWSYDANSFATVTVADASHTTVATGESGNLTLDAAGAIVLDADSGDVTFSDAGVAQLAVDMDGTAGEIIVKPMVASDDLVFKTQGNTEVLRFEDNGDVDIAGGFGSTGVTVSSAGAISIDGISTLGATTGATVSAAGLLNINNTTDATSTTDGSLQTDGGLSVALDTVVGNDLILLSDASVVHFGAGKDITLTHVADTGLTLKNVSTTGNSGVGAVLTLATGDTGITSTNVLGEIKFQAPDEAAGSDAILTAAGIAAVSTGAFSGTSNATKLSFRTAQSEAATEKMYLSPSGQLVLPTDGVAITMGANYEIALTHRHNEGLQLSHSGTTDNLPVKLTLKSFEADVQADDVIGALDFKGGDGLGGDAILVCAGIEAVSEGDFSATNNATKLSFKTAVSEAAAEKMALSSAGNLSIAGDLTVTGNDITFGNGATIVNTSSNLLTITEAEVLLPTTSKLSFHDTGGGENIVASSDGHLEVNAGTTLDMTAPTVDITASTAVTMTTPSMVIDSDTAEKPVLEIKNTHAGAAGATLQLTKDGASVADNDVVGNLTFVSEDEGSNVQTYANIVTAIDVDAAGEESGKLSLKVASHDGGVEDGLVLTGGSVDAEVDVTIGNGAASVVTVPGFISIGGHAINDVDVAGEFVDSDEHLMTAAAINDRFAISGAVDELNELSDVSFGSGDLTITSLDTLTTSATAHNAAGTALLIQGGNTTAGTTNNIAGGNLTLAAGQGKGTGAGGDIIFKTANQAAGSASSINALATALTISDDLSSTFAGDATFGADDTGVDVRIFSATASEGLLYDASEDELGLLLTTKLKFHDIGGGEEIFASANGHLEINSGTTLDMTAPTVDINASTAVTIDGPAVTITSSTSAKPVLTLSNTNADANSAELKFNNDSATGADNDVMGKISFYGTDAAENAEQELAFLDAIITDSADGSEAASMRFFVAENDGTRTAGLVIAGQADADGEVDVTIGAGAASTTTVAGELTAANSTFNISQSSSDVTIKATTSNKDMKFNVNDGGVDTTVMTLDGDVSAAIMNKVFAKTITAVAAANETHTEVQTNTSPFVTVNCSGTSIEGNATDGFHDLGLIAGTVAGQTVTVSVGAGDFPTTILGVRIARGPTKAIAAGLGVASLPTNGHTLIITDSAGTANTITFDTGVSIGSSARNASTTNVATVGIASTPTTTQVAQAIVLVQNQMLDANDNSVLAVVGSGASFILLQTVGGVAGNTGQTGAIAGTAPSAGSIGDSTGAGFVAGAAAPSGLDTSYSRFGFSLLDQTRTFVGGGSESATFVWDGTKWVHVSGGTALTS